MQVPEDLDEAIDELALLADKIEGAQHGRTRPLHPPSDDTTLRVDRIEEAVIRIVDVLKGMRGQRKGPLAKS
jgi:hypothetical protein